MDNAEELPPIKEDTRKIYRPCKVCKEMFEEDLPKGHFLNGWSITHLKDGGHIISFSYKVCEGLDVETGYVVPNEKQTKDEQISQSN